MRKVKVLALAAGTAAAAGLFAPRIARAVDTWQESRRQAWIQQASAALKSGSDQLPPLPWGVTLEEEVSDTSGKEPVSDDPEMRALQQLLIFGDRTPQYQAKLLEIAQQENAKAAAIADADPATVSTVTSSVVAANIGPAGARSEFNGSYYPAQDSGRVRAIRVHPTNPNIVYIATTGGGVWKTSNFHTASGAPGTSGPTWVPLTDSVAASIDLGAMDIDPQNPSNIFVGTGEHGDQLPGGSVMRSNDGGATWQTPVLLTTTLPLVINGTPSPMTLTATQVRSVIVDPANSSNIMAATDVGLFRSIDGGASFSWIDLPNLPNYTALTGANATNFGLESNFDVVYIGQVGGVSQFLVSGDYACPGTSTTVFLPVVRSQHRANCSTGASGGALLWPGSPVTTGTFGDIWKSTDGGATWSSMRLASKLPTQAATWGQTGSDSQGLPDMGRIGIAASTTGDPSTAAVYAQGASIASDAAQTVLIFNTRDGGNTWNKLATPRSAVFPAANAVLTNPTAGTSCNNMNVGHGQSWYNVAVAVDPGDQNRAILGGNLCGYRTVDGGATWQLAAFWLPTSGGGDTADGAGPLPYVHADWHTATISRVGGRYVTLAGSDGGIYSSYDVFDKTPANLANWAQPDYGLITTLPYGHATGDPVFGNHNVLFAGYQDNGTRWRLSQTENIAINTLLNFDQIQGGDGTGNAVTNDPNGQNQVFWAGLPTGPRSFCRPAARDCGRATTIVDGNEFANWFQVAITKPAGDSDPFTIRYSPVFDSASSVITASTFNVYKLQVNPLNDGVTSFRMTPSGIVTPGLNGVNATRNVVNQHVHASPWTYTINSKPTRVYGVMASGGTFLHILDDGTTFTSIPSAKPINGLDANGNPLALSGSSSIAYFKNPADLAPGVSDPTQAYIVGCNSPVPGSAQAPSMVHLYKTGDNGLTWVSVAGNHTPAPSGIGTLDLPNVPVYVVRIDYSDPTEKTWYVGTELGLYRTTDGGDTWGRYGGVIPAARIIDLTVSLNGNLVRASTYGRGIWEMWPHSEQSASFVSDMDWDKNGVIDFRDVIATASRIGKTPAANINDTNNYPAFYQEPRFDAVVDANGDGLIDQGNDLTLELQKFGGAP